MSVYKSVNAIGVAFEWIACQLENWKFTSVKIVLILIHLELCCSGEHFNKQQVSYSLIDLTKVS